MFQKNDYRLFFTVVTLHNAFLIDSRILISERQRTNPVLKSFLKLNMNAELTSSEKTLHFRRNFCRDFFESK